MDVKQGYVYKNADNEYYTPAQSGQFYIVDCWKCDKNGNVEDINENPWPTPVSTSDFKRVKATKNNYSYPKPQMLWK